MTTALVNGLRMSFDDVGTSGIPLVLIHGHPFDRTMWAPQLAHFGSTGQRVIAPDLRGFGQSVDERGVTHWSEFAEDIAALLDQLDIANTVVAGLSMGGQIAMEFARLHPERIRGIVLAATFPDAESGEGKARRKAVADRLLREGMERYALELLPKMLAPATLASMPSVAEHVLGMMQGAHPIGAAAALRARAERPAYEPVLVSLRRPAIIFAGDHDAFTTRAEAERMRSLLPDSELVWMEGVGHMPNLERAAEFNAVLERFLGLVSASV